MLHLRDILADVRPPRVAYRRSISSRLANGVNDDFLCEALPEIQPCGDDEDKSDGRSRVGHKLEEFDPGQFEAREIVNEE
jgi:hypothetical protein